ncbi:MAG: polyribonucleotide nucleotidyltransferase [Phycisphaerae bacterium]|nr:polyribonucleotide nucleotidyltransferase [Phycisphaerae bacterium]
MVFKVERQVGSRVLSVEVGKIAKQAAGAAVVRYGDTVVLGTVVTSDPRPGIDFFPLQVDYRERMAAAGKFPGGFFKREGRPSSKEILSARMIDRPIRPRFPKDFRDEVQIQVMTLATDCQHDPDVLCMVAAAAALGVSPLPFLGPVAGVRVGRVDGNFIVNPSQAEMEYSDLDLVLAGHRDGVNMIEIGAHELSESVLVDSIKFGYEQGVLPICEMLDELKRHAGKPATWEAPEKSTALLEEIRGKVRDKIVAAKQIGAKLERQDAVAAVYDEALAEYCPEGATETKYTRAEVNDALQTVEKEVIRTRILAEGVRPDGRATDQIRPIACEVGWLPRTHGSSLFTRGETQAMVTTTLGTSRDEQTIDDMLGEYSKKFILHYYFPPYSVGEVGRIMGPGRREIGHGALAERSLQAVLPSPDDFPYTIRLVSDITESNGSSSMATVCGGTLSLMDAGVPITAPVAGISVGMVSDGDKHRLLLDILGEEDHFGDMDFKVAGTKDGVTGVQLDLKADAVSYEVIQETFELARKGRLHILGEITKTLAAPRPQISENAPRLLTIKIDPEKIGKVIGPGGKSIKALQADTGAQIDIEDDGTVYISCLDADGAERARDAIARMTEEIKVGRIYEGKVTTIRDFGAFVELVEGQDGLCHISELDEGYVKSVNDVVKLGDKIKVKVIAVDDQGRIKLSRKAAMKEDKE